MERGQVQRGVVCFRTLTQRGERQSLGRGATVAEVQRHLEVRRLWPRAGSLVDMCECAWQVEVGPERGERRLLQ